MEARLLPPPKERELRRENIGARPLLPRRLLRLLLPLRLPLRLLRILLLRSPRDGSKLERGPIVLDKPDDGDEKTIGSID